MAIEELIRPFSTAGGVGAGSLRNSPAWYSCSPRDVMEKTLKLSARVTIPDSLLFREIEGEAVILDPRDGQYYGLDEVGTRIFQLMGDHPSLTPVFEQLLAEFEVDGPSLERDLLRFADQLAAHNLVELAGG